MFRDGMRLLVEATSTVRVTEVVADEESLQAACRSESVTAVLFEATEVAWNVAGMVERLRAMTPAPILVATYVHEYRRHEVLEGVAYVRRTSPSQAFVGALQGKAVGAVPEVRSRLTFPESDSLTQRELQVLALISGGSTTSQIAERLGISAKTVENRRQALFAKLGVQNQSHAVAVAMRTGLLGVGTGGPGPRE
jgi:DNA-binding NarL/FixJ family response regulator